jgi:hypothetical protein
MAGHGAGSMEIKSGAPGNARWLGAHSRGCAVQNGSLRPGGPVLDSWGLFLDIQFGW